MANVKFTDLTEDTTPADNDWLATVDVSAGSNKKVTRTNLFKNPPLAANSITNTMLAHNAAWTSWSPTWTNFTVGNGTQNAYYQQIGKAVCVYLDFVMGTTSTVTGAVTSDLPVVARFGGGTAKPLMGVVRWEDVGVNNCAGFVQFDGTNSVSFVFGVVAGSSPNYLHLGNWTSGSNPFALSTGDYFTYTVTYEAA